MGRLPERPHPHLGDAVPPALRLPPPRRIRQLRRAVRRRPSSRPRPPRLRLPTRIRRRKHRRQVMPRPRPRHRHQRPRRRQPLPHRRRQRSPAPNSPGCATTLKHSDGSHPAGPSQKAWCAAALSAPEPEATSATVAASSSRGISKPPEPWRRILTSFDSQNRTYSDAAYRHRGGRHQQWRGRTNSPPSLRTLPYGLSETPQTRCSGRSGVRAECPVTVPLSDTGLLTSCACPPCDNSRADPGPCIARTLCRSR